MRAPPHLDMAWQRTSEDVVTETLAPCYVGIFWLDWKTIHNQCQRLHKPEISQTEHLEGVAVWEGPGWTSMWASSDILWGTVPKKRFVFQHLLFPSFSFKVKTAVSHFSNLFPNFCCSKSCFYSWCRRTVLFFWRCPVARCPLSFWPRTVALKWFLLSRPFSCHILKDCNIPLCCHLSRCRGSTWFNLRLLSVCHADQETNPAAVAAGFMLRTATGLCAGGPWVNLTDPWSIHAAIEL